MATAISKVADPGNSGDWPTMNAALAANFGATSKDLVSEDEDVLNTLKNTNGGNLASNFVTIDGFTTDATRSLLFQVPQAFKHNAIYPTSGVITGNVSHMTVVGDASLLIRDDNVTVEDMVLISQPSTSWIQAVTVDGHNILLDRCLIVVDSRATSGPNETYGVWFRVTAGEVCTIRNSVIMALDEIGKGHIRYGVYQDSTAGGLLILENCLIYSTDNAIRIRQADGIRLKNCVVVSGDGYDINNYAWLEAGSGGNAYSDSGAAVDISSVALTSMFQNPNAYDWRLTQNSVLRDAGSNLISDGVTVDILDNARPGTAAFDIGPHQFGGGGLNRPIYLVEKSEAAGKTSVDGVKLLVVEAPSEAAARDVASSRVAGDSTWADATVTEIQTSVDYSGIEVSIFINEQPFASYTATIGQTVDDIGAALVLLLNANGSIGNAAYSAGTLTVAGTVDRLGDGFLEVKVKIPGTNTDLSSPGESIIGTITDQGDPGDALSVDLVDSGLARILGSA
jgi:hypothetical protein